MRLTRVDFINKQVPLVPFQLHSSVFDYRYETMTMMLMIMYIFFILIQSWMLWIPNEIVDDWRTLSHAFSLSLKSQNKRRNVRNMYRNVKTVLETHGLLVSLGRVAVCLPSISWLSWIQRRHVLVSVSLLDRWSGINRSYLNIRVPNSCWTRILNIILFQTSKSVHFWSIERHRTLLYLLRTQNCNFTGRK